MKHQRLITSLLSVDPAAASEFFQEHLGMDVMLDIGWFISLVHPDHPGTEIAITRADHDSVPPTHRHPAQGVAIAVVVEDASAVHASLTANGCPPLGEPVDHPWGQRQFFAPGPDGVLLDVVQVTTPDAAWLRENGLLDQP